MGLLSSALRGLGRLLTYMLIGFIVFLIFMACVGVFFKVMFPIFQSEGPQALQVEEQQKVREEKIKKEAILRVTNGSYSFCFIKNGKQYYFEILGWAKPNSTILRQYITL